ncbi:MAG: hypothetical protein WC657_05540 [Candidatus Paceibacterota bacterium]
MPTGTTIIPIELMIYFEAFGTTAQSEVNATIGSGGSYTSGGTAMTPSNLRVDKPYSSAVTAYNLSTVTGATTNVTEFYRDGEQFAITKTAGSATVAVSDPHRFTWSIKDAFVAPIGVGPCQVAVNQGSQAGTGFGYIKWVEVPTSDLP